MKNPFKYTYAGKHLGRLQTDAVYADVGMRTAGALAFGMLVGLAALVVIDGVTLYVVCMSVITFGMGMLSIELNQRKLELSTLTKIMALTDVLEVPDDVHDAAQLLNYVVERGRANLSASAEEEA